MWTNKNPVGGLGLLAALGTMLLGLVNGCSRSGPAALREGIQLIDKGRPADAIKPLQHAVSLLSSNATVWNYLGIAYQGAGDSTNAFDCYVRALKFNPSLAEAHFNLGCLFLNSGQPERGRDEFAAFTVREPQDPEGWLKRGISELRTRNPVAAEQSFTRVLELAPDNVEALNGWGISKLQRNRIREAAALFQRAWNLQTNYAPALLNLAVVEQRYLKNPARALEHYRAYLALEPRPPAADDVEAAVASLTEQLQPKPKPQPKAEPKPEAADTAVAKNPASNPAPTPRPANSNLLASNAKEPSEPARPNTRTAPPTTTPTPPTAVHSQGPVVARTEVRQDQAPEREPQPGREPEVRSEPEQTARAQDSAAVAPLPPARTTIESTTARETNETASVADNPTTETQPEPKREGFLQRVNPVNWFDRGKKEDAAPPPVNLASATSTNRDASENTEPGSPPQGVAAYIASARKSTPAALDFKRYNYTIAAPARGNRTAALPRFQDGVTAQRAGDLKEAIKDYRTAIGLDPALFEAHYNLGVAAYAAGQISLALMADETALALRPNSRNTRYNFALALRAGDYPLDAEDQLNRLLESNPNETRVHYTLGNLYAQQLGKPDLAREQYRRVLALDPNHPQSAFIRSWLAANAQ